MIDAIMRGDDMVISLEIVEYISEEMSVPIDITGYIIYFTAKRYADMEDAEADIQVQATILDAANGIAQIILNREQTRLLVPGNLEYDIQMTSPTGSVSTIDRGTAIVYSDITRREA